MQKTYVVRDDRTERQEPQQPQEKLRFLSHSLIEFVYDSDDEIIGPIKGSGGMKSHHIV